MSFLFVAIKEHLDTHERQIIPSLSREAIKDGQLARSRPKIFAAALWNHYFDKATC